MKRRQLKKHVLALLDHHDVNAVYSELSGLKPHELLNPLFIALCATSEVVRWNAISVFGKVVPEIAREDMESARIIMRRFLWTLNDESGGIGWGAPEAMAEIMVMHDGLASEYLHMLISYMREDGPELFQDGNYLELPMLQRGLLWGIGRLCFLKPEMMRERGVEEDLMNYLISKDAVVRGLAVWCLTGIGSSDAKTKILEMGKDMAEVKIYSQGYLQKFTIAELVQRYTDAVIS